MMIWRSDDLVLAVGVHRWQRPRIWTDEIPMDWLETMVCLGFVTLTYERWK